MHRVTPNPCYDDLSAFENSSVAPEGFYYEHLTKMRIAMTQGTVAQLLFTYLCLETQQ